MQTTSKNKAAEKPSAARRAVVPEKNRPGKDGSGQASNGTGALGGIGFPILSKNLRPVSLFELKLLSGSDESIFKIIDAEARQLQAIEDLYAIVKAQPKYKKLKEPVWKPETAPSEVLQWLLRKLGPLAGGNPWTVDTYPEGTETRFRFVVYKHYHSQKLKSRPEYMPLDFLPMLVKRDKPLHDLIIDVIALVSRCNKIPLWDEDGDFSEALERLKEGPISGNETLDRQRRSYTSGPAASYLKLIKRRRRLADREQISKDLVNYKDNSERKRMMIRWLVDGLRMADTGKLVKTFSYVPHYLPGNPVTPSRQYKFIWSFHDNDVLKKRAFSKLRADEKAGDYYPLQFSITRPGQVMKPVEYDSFPEQLYDFMSWGTAIVLWRYRQYFYRKSFEEQKTPAETLLEIIEISEFETANHE